MTYEDILRLEKSTNTKIKTKCMCAFCGKWFININQSYTHHCENKYMKGRKK